jgi:hypothetical protein
VISNAGEMVRDLAVRGQAPLDLARRLEALSPPGAQDATLQKYGLSPKISLIQAAACNSFNAPQSQGVI